MLCGPEAAAVARARVPCRAAFARCLAHATKKGPAILAPALAAAALPELAAPLLPLPGLVALHRPLPGTVEDLHRSLRTSTTREDLRRIRKAGFRFEILRDVATLRRFHARYATPLLDARFPEDGGHERVETFLARLGAGGELICLYRGDDWLAGIFNTAEPEIYALGTLGIRDGCEDIRRMHVTAALIVKSLERAVELGYSTASLGRSLPFLGKGPVWFKAKWGGVPRHDPARPRLGMLADLRLAATRRMLSDRPVLFAAGDRLELALWQRPGAEALGATLRDAARFAGIARWHVFGARKTIAAGRARLDGAANLVPVAVPDSVPEPVWLGGALSRQVR